MRRLPTIVLLLALTAVTLAAQPITYMIPDIGTPGMNTYVEIIAPAAETGKFLLVDGLASPSILNIKFINPADSSRVKVSPGVVSWNQRMVSFQFFVPPGAALGAVPMQLQISGQLLPIDTFFIVSPQPFGAKNGGGIIGSSGTYGTGMGKRSKRGAMIVDEMTLDNGTYTIDVSDCDPAALGNQGYLPIIILSKGKIAINTGATISASAPKGLASKHGGPGGGGGGGYGADRPAALPILVNIPGENDAPLGDGYTGGRSNVPVVPSPGGSGEGTGVDAASLNGLTAVNTFKTSALTARLYAGGPGHPFDVDGRSGGAAVATANIPPNIIGTYYGGGGNASKGTGLPLAQDDYNGQVVGNVELAPLHGGAGGSSGGFNDSVGGGGGGAIALYAGLNARVASAEARGGDGKNGCDACGFGTGDASAGGAGGGVVIGGKTGVSITQVYVEGGHAGITAATATAGSTSGNGGGGRFRSDGRVAGNVILVPNISQYSGPTTDTLTYASSLNWTIRGTGRFQPRDGGDSILVFVRGQNSGWNFNAPYGTRVKSDSTWSVAITFPGDTLAYVFAVQMTPQLELTSATPFTQVPTHIFSQAAANIVHLQTQNPVLVAPSARSFDTMICPAIVCDTFAVRNTGTARLIIAPGTAFTGANAALYRLQEPKLPDTIQPGGSSRWIVCFDGTLAANGQRGTVLRLITNDPANPTWNITYTVQRSAATALVAGPPSIAFGDVQTGSSQQRVVVITNPAGAGSVPQTISGFAIVPANPQVRVLWPAIPPPRTLAPGDTMHIVLEYAPTLQQVLPAIRLAMVRNAPCADSMFYPISGKGIKAAVVASKNSLTIIDSNCTTPSPAEDTLRILNTGSAPVNLTGLVATPSNLFTVIPPLPTGTMPSGGSVVVHVRFTPSKAVDTLGTLTVTSSDPERPSFTVELRGVRDTVVVEPASRTIQFRQKLSCEPPVDTLITLYNRGNATAILNPVNITAPFQLGAPPPYIIPPHDSLVVKLTFVPGTNGNFTAEMQYTVSPCGARDTIKLRGEQITPAYTITAVAFGDVTVGGSGTGIATVTNTTGTGLRISGARVVPGPGEFSVNPAQFPIRIAAGGSAPVSFTFTPAAVGDIAAGVTVEVDIDSLCATTITAPVTGRAVAGGVSLSRSSISFGTVLACQTPADTLTITNVSAIPIALGAPVIVPPSAAANFTVAGGTFTPGDLAPGASSTLVVRFIPDAGPNGPRTATMQITTNDPLRPRIDVPLDADLESALLALSGPGFGPVGGGFNTNVTRWIVNTGTAPVTVDAVQAPVPFAVLSVTPALPATLLPGDSLAVSIEFAPPVPGTFTDSLRVSARYLCDSATFVLNGTAIDLSVINAIAVWDDATGAPGDTVRIALRLKDDIAKAGVTVYTASARFNPSMLYPLRIVLDGTLSNGWTIAPQQLSRGIASFTASGSTPLSGTGVLAYLDALVTLGDSVATPIARGDSVGLNSPRALLVLNSGTFTLQGYCTAGGARLVAAGTGAGLKSVRPNPVTGNSDVELQTIEQGRTQLVLADALGRDAAMLLDADLAPGSYIVTLQRGDLPAGVYYLELRTPTARDRVKVLVVR